VLGLHNVDLVVFAWNKPAIRCYEKAGFRLIGRRRGGAVCMGRRFDVVIMDAIAEEFTGSVLTALIPERRAAACSDRRAACSERVRGAGGHLVGHDGAD
jgi:hypothetical protein